MKRCTNIGDSRKLVILSQLAGMLDRSLARYLLDARPWSRRPYLLLGAVAKRLADEHGCYAGKIVRLLHARGHNVPNDTYPMEFTYYNDLSLDYLAPRLLEHQRCLIGFAYTASSELVADSEVRRLLEKLLISLRKYGALLDELLASHQPAPPSSGYNNRPAATSGRGPQDTPEANAAYAEPQTAA